MDIEYLLLLQNFRNATGGVLDTFMEVVSELVIGPLSIVAIAIIYWCVNKKVGAQIMLNIGSGKTVSQLVKNVCCVYRPWIRDPRVIPAGDSMRTATGYSFPSGHTQLATAEFMTVAVWQKKRKWVVVLCTAITFLVMFSRNYLGVHTPQDVIVGFLLCCLSIYVNEKLVRWADGSKDRDLIFLISGILLCAAFLAFITLKSYPLDYKESGEILVDPYAMMTDCYVAAGLFMGALTGWVTERHLIQFEKAKNTKTAVIRVLVGIVTLLVIHKLVSPAMIAVCGAHFGEFIGYTILVFWIMAGYPFLFKLVENGRGVKG